MSSNASGSALHTPQLFEVLDELPDAVLLLGADWRIVYLNRAGMRLLEPFMGTEVRELRGLDYWTKFNGVLGTPVEEVLRWCMRERKPAQLDVFYPTWQRWFSARVAPGGDGGLTAFFQDIHEQRQREMEQRTREEKLRLEFAELESIYRTAPLGLAVLDLDLRFVRINEHLARINGRPAADHVGRRISEVLNEEAEETARRMCEQLRETGEPVRFELEIARPTEPHNPRVWDEKWYPLRDGDGKIAAYGAVVEEVTERKQRERRLSAEAKLLADAMPQLVWTAFPDGSVDYYNERISSYVGARYIDHRWQWEAMLHPDDAEVTRRAWMASMQSGEVFSITHRVLTTSGTYRWHLSRAVPVRDANGNIVKWFGTATDIDEQKRLEERLEETVRQRTASLRETVVELEAYSYSISHDMRAPLRAMRTFAHFLESEYGDKLESEGRQYLARIIAAADRLDRLIQDVLAYSRVTGGEMTLEDVDVNDLLAELIGTYPQFREASISVEGELPHVRANKAALTQCLSNLLGNGVKFARPGVAPQIVVTGERRGDRAALRLRDNGVGIPEDAQGRIFEMFFQHEPAGGGTGIGLSIVRKAAERMGGRVYLESSSPEGSTFVLELAAAK